MYERNSFSQSLHFILIPYSLGNIFTRLTTLSKISLSVVLQLPFTLVFITNQTPLNYYKHAWYVGPLASPQIPVEAISSPPGAPDKAESGPLAVPVSNRNTSGRNPLGSHQSGASTGPGHPHVRACCYNPALDPECGPKAASHQLEKSPQI